MITITQMKPHHVGEIARIEQLCFSAPWSERSIAYELSNPLSLWLVAVDGDQLVGYVGSQSVMDEADMMNIAVLPEFRRLGVAESLVIALCDELRRKKVTSLALEVRASNEAARALYAKLGFVQAGRRPNYYRAPKEDALILRKEWQE